MNGEIHIVPIGQYSWAVEVGKTSYQAFDSEEKALQFSQIMASRSGNDGCKIIIHDEDGNMFPIDEYARKH